MNDATDKIPFPRDEVRGFVGDIGLEILKIPLVCRHFREAARSNSRWPPASSRPRMSSAWDRPLRTVGLIVSGGTVRTAVHDGRTAIIPGYLIAVSAVRRGPTTRTGNDGRRVIFRGVTHADRRSFPARRRSARDVGAVRAYGRRVEELGFGHVLAYDHVLGADPAVHEGWNGPYDVSTTFHEPMVLFGYLAALTSLEMVTGIIILPQRQTALVAKQAAQVDILTGGKFRLGVGLGWNKVEYEALGQDFTTRGRRIDEQVPLLRRLWTEPSLTFTGSSTGSPAQAWPRCRCSARSPSGSAPNRPPRLPPRGPPGRRLVPQVAPGPKLTEAKAAVDEAATARGPRPRHPGHGRPPVLAGRPGRGGRPGRPVARTRRDPPLDQHDERQASAPSTTTSPPWKRRHRPGSGLAPPRLAGLLPNSAVDPVEEVGQRDLQIERGQLPLVEVGGRRVPDLVGHPRRAVLDAGGRLGQRERRPLRLGEERRLAPGDHVVQPLIGLPVLLGRGHPAKTHGLHPLI